MIRKIAIIGFKIFVLVNIVFGLVGISSIFLTISFYFLIWYVATGVCVFFVRNAEKRINYRLFITVFVIALFGCELVLKYGTKSHLSYSEKNGNFFYNSMYRKGYLENYKRKYNQKQSDIQIFTRKPYGNVILSKPEFMYEHSYNSLGLRDKEPKCDTGIYTIIGLGDSFTEGVGSPQDSTWLRLLEANISGREKTRSFQTINAGVSDSDPFAEYLLLERKLMIYKPDLVIVAVNTTDVDDIIVRGGMERFVDGSIEYNSGPWWEFFYQFSYIVRVVVHRVLHYNFMLLSDQQYEMRKKIAMQ
ncbi:MAG: hypothetical protein KKA07_07995, partial [Bacteroidetes bacterium]|nr:hypothetical protein [Bacteroidota bacterium]MBU1719005.1 hypothetical protein [Bacteroidota bacterium]